MNYKKIEQVYVIWSDPTLPVIKTTIKSVMLYPMS